MTTRTESGEPASTPPQAWTEDDLRRDPHAAADKASRVRRMFAAIAPKYDLNNRLHSFGRDQAWRRAAVRMAELKATDRVVDVACGTGDLAIALNQALLQLQPGLSIGEVLRRRVPCRSPLPRPWMIGIDFTYEMLPIARRKSAAPGWAEDDDSDVFVNADAMRLPLPNACCDVVSIAFGIRNVAEPAKAMREFYRVLRPGGRCVVLEFSQPTNPLIRWGNNLYCGKIMPHTATWIAGDKSGAYKYLPKSVDTFVTREGMVSMMEASGFRDVVLKPLTFGVAVVYRGVKK